MFLTSYDITRLEAAKAFIDKNNRLHHSIGEISHEVGMGTTKLKEGFKYYFGTGLYGYLREQRMQLALLLLQDRNKTIKLIAKETGFKYTSNFTKAFNKRFGITPGGFRKARHLGKRMGR